MFGILGKRTIKFGRDPVVLLGFLVHIVSFYLAFLNLSSDCPFTHKDGVAYQHTYITPK